MKRQRRQCAAVVELDPCTVAELDHCSRESVDFVADGGNQPVAVHSKVRVKNGAIVEVHELMLSSSLDPRDSSLTQSSRCCVGKLAKNGGMKCSGFRYGLAFNGATKALHCFFNFRQLWHFPSEKSQKRLAYIHCSSSFLAALTVLRINHRGV
jgi:hypothetical protein